MTQVRQRDREATRRRLLDAAAALFAEHGYEQVTVRMIATEAGANVSLINRYFGSKAELFGEVVADESTLGQVLEGDADGLPRRLAEYTLRRLETGPESPVLRSLGSLSCSETTEVLRDRLLTGLVAPLAARLDGPDAGARAMLAASVLLGAGPLRRLFGPDALAAGSPEEMTDRLTGVFRLCLA